MARPSPDQLLTLGALAHYLGLPQKRIRQAVRSGALPAYQVGGWRRVRLGDARDWLEQQRFEPDHHNQDGAG